LIKIHMVIAALRDKIKSEHLYAETL
jgi:hypothetical protein